MVAGCGGGTPTSFGLNVTVDAHSVASGDLARITTASLTVSGAEQYSKSFDISSPVKSGEVRFRYVPRAQSGQLTLALDALDGTGAAVASGVSDAVDIATGKAVPVTIVLGTTSTDLGAADLGDEDGGAAGDMTHVVKGQGAACTSNADCGTAGGCVDGFCCDTTCTDGCSACNLTGKEGACSPVPAGSPPTAGHAGCGPDPKSGCQRDGMCDGAGACRKWALGTICQAGTCNSTTNMVTSDSTCDGSGTCKPGTTITCAPYLCKDANVCYPSCTSGGNQCSAGNVCNGTSCGKKPLGSMCTTSADCQNGTDSNPHCVDGVCCDTACAGTCQYCALGTSKGTCSLVPTGQDPRSVCPAGSGNDAACTPGGCSGTAQACRLATSGTPCAGACLSNAPSNTTCNATGSCNVNSMGSACGAYVCSVGGGGTIAACKTMCGSDADCVMPTYGCKVVTGKCLLVDGLSCGSDGTVCESGNCVQGVCCDTPCAGTVLGGGQTAACQTCTASGAVGTCTNLANTCRPASCSGNMGHPAMACSAGACPAQATNNCGNYICNSDGSCLSYCGICAGSCPFGGNCAINQADCYAGTCTSHCSGGGNIGSGTWQCQ